MASLVPHFDLPFRMKGTSFATVEQDSFEDVANCVEAIVRTPYGFRDDNPDFGVDDQTFQVQPLNTELITGQIIHQEPRASIVITQETDLIDSLIDNLKIEVDG